VSECLHEHISRNVEFMGVAKIYRVGVRSDLPTRCAVAGIGTRIQQQKTFFPLVITRKSRARLKMWTVEEGCVRSERSIHRLCPWNVTFS